MTHCCSVTLNTCRGGRLVDSFCILANSPASSTYFRVGNITTQGADVWNSSLQFNNEQSAALDRTLAQTAEENERTFAPAPLGTGSALFGAARAARRGDLLLTHTLTRRLYKYTGLGRAERSAVGQSGAARRGSERLR